MSFITFNNINLSFAQHQIFNNFNLSIASGQRLALLGASGVGKSSLLKLLTGIYQPNAGKVHCRAKRIGYVFQEPRLLPWLTVYDNLAQVLMPYKLSNSTITAKITALLAQVELSDFRDCYPHQLSGGMAQRVSLARAFAIAPDLLLMDEPLSALDPLLKQQLSQFIADYLSQHQATLIYVSHAANEALPLVDTALLLRRHQAAAHYPVKNTNDTAHLHQLLSQSEEL